MIAITGAVLALIAWCLVARSTNRTSKINYRTAAVLTELNSLNRAIADGLPHWTKAPDVNDVTVESANHVLYMVDIGSEPGQFYPPGDFFQQLIRAMLWADPQNFERLWRAYPEYGAAVWLWNRSGREDGPDTLRAVALGPAEAKPGATS